MPPLELNIPRLSVDILLGSAADQIKLATFNFYVIQLSSQIPPVPISLVSLVDPTIVPRLISLFQTVSGTAEIEFANLRFGASQNETTITTFSRSRIYFSVPLKATPSAIQLTQFVFSIVPLRVQAEIISALPVNITLAPWITADVSNAVGAKLARVNITGQRKGSVTVNEGNQGFEMEAKDVNIGALLQFGVDKADHTVQIGNVVVEGVRWLTEGLVGLSLRIPTDNFFG
ncbi:hypothetical protein BJ742DRAFT_835510 [Cladochytrium replicatum]|nr:hypothetical protein BJ742DRAFT_835510 [Cladochytrium replicatum]